MQIPDYYADAIDLLHEQAAASMGLEDFGNPAYREGLQVLLESYDETAQFGDIGRYSAWTMALNCLRGRLYAIEGIKRHPKSLDQPIEKPLFIIGLPRTGTTILHRLLASLPGHQGLEYWLGSYPRPRTPRASWSEDEHFREVERSLQMMNELNPQLRKIHEMNADAVDECRLLLMQSFANVTFQANATVPRYERWLYQADMDQVYRLYRQSLQLIGSNDPGRRWVLKDPSHLWALDQLLETFPDATIIQTHRDPVKLIPSVCSLVLTARRMQEPEVTPQLVGEAELDQWDMVLNKGLSVRRQHPERFIDLHFDDFVRDPIAAVQGIFTKMTEPMDEQTLGSMRDWMADNPQHKHGEHSYRAADFGLDETEIRRRFADYCDYFEVKAHVA